MVVHPAVIVHGLEDAHAALRPGLPVTLLSSPGAALHAGCLWWQGVIKEARALCPATESRDLLDCADGSGQAMAALRIGLRDFVLWPTAPGRNSIVSIVRERGGCILESPPAAWDMAAPDALSGLAAWLRKRSATGDIGSRLG